jgi:hypothetical protein
VAAATLVSRRLGHRAGGLVGGLPLAAAPIVLVYDVESGDAFAREAAAGGALGLVSPVLFCLAYAACARRTGYVVAVIAGWLAYGAGIAVLSGVHPPLAGDALIALVAIGGGSWLLSRAVSGPVAVVQTSDLLVWRLMLTAALVLAITAIARGLSAHLAGLLSTFPIITPVLAAFAQARVGPDAAIEMLSGLVPALVCFLAFFTTLAATLGPLGAPAAFALSTVVCLALWGVLLAVVSLSASPGAGRLGRSARTRVRRRRRSTPRPRS